MRVKDFENAAERCGDLTEDVARLVNADDFNVQVGALSYVLLAAFMGQEKPGRMIAFDRMVALMRERLEKCP